MNSAPELALPPERAPVPILIVDDRPEERLALSCPNTSLAGA
jgi:hypothetical protein